MQHVEFSQPNKGLGKEINPNFFSLRTSLRPMEGFVIDSRSNTPAVTSMTAAV